MAKAKKSCSLFEHSSGCKTIVNKEIQPQAKCHMPNVKEMLNLFYFCFSLIELLALFCKRNNFGSYKLFNV